MKKFLSTFGKIAINAAGIVSGIGPIFAASIPKSAGPIGTVISDLAQVAGVIQTIEVAAQAASAPIPGAEKLKMATPLVAQAILQSSLLAGHKIANPTLFQQGSQKIADGMADIVNAIDEGSVKITKTEDVKV